MDGDDASGEKNVLFLVNKNGFPMDDETYERMWDHAAKHHEDGYSMVVSIRSSNDLKHVSIPQAPISMGPSVSTQHRLEMIQKYMETLQYNHTGTQMFDIRKYRPLSALMDVAKDMIKESLPIKCLEALILGIYLTNSIEGMERFTISFKSSFSHTIHRHVVLGIFYGSYFGSIGMSRRSDLMHKPLQYKTLAELIFDYMQKYANYSHEIKRVKIGMPIPHEPHSNECIRWKGLILNPGKQHRCELSSELDRHSRIIRANVRNVNNVSRNKLSANEISKSFHSLHIESPSPTRCKRSSSVKKSKSKSLSKSYQLRI